MTLSPMLSTPMLSIVIPTLNAARHIAPALDTLAGAPVAEIIVVDAASVDGTAELAIAHGARVITAARGRGRQFAAGIEAARGPWLLLLHADTRPGPGWRQAVRAHMAAAADAAGYFRFTLASADPRARRLERLVVWRCRALALPYGDQGLLIHRDLLAKIGGMRPLALMEDVDLARRLGRSRLRALAADGLTSAEKWERDGWMRRSLRNLCCLSLYFLGLPPRIIARFYR